MWVGEQGSDGDVDRQLRANKELCESDLSLYFKGDREGQEYQQLTLVVKRWGELSSVVRDAVVVLVGGSSDDD